MRFSRLYELSIFQNQLGVDIEYFIQTFCHLHRNRTFSTFSLNLTAMVEDYAERSGQSFYGQPVDCIQPIQGVLIILYSPFK